MLDGRAVTDAIRAAFSEHGHGVPCALTRNLEALVPGAFVLATEDPEFAIERFAHAGKCGLAPVDGTTFDPSSPRIRQAGAGRWSAAR